MILILTHKTDYTADYVINKLNNLDIPFFRFNCEDILEYDISFQSGDQNSISINGHDSFTSVWFRRTKLPELQHPDISERLFLLGEIETLLSNLLAILDVKWLSKPQKVTHAENKLLQLKYAQQLGFAVPKTLVTTQRRILTEFIKQNERTIIKPIGRGRIDYPDNTTKLLFTNILPKEIAGNLEQFSLIPAIYQAYVEKEYEIRVTLVGDEIFSAKVDSQSHDTTSIDWRRHKVGFQPYHLPLETEILCRRLLKKFDLNFGAFDFIKGKDGVYYFLEVNPNGQWVWIENDTNLPISNAVIDFLKC